MRAAIIDREPAVLVISEKIFPALECDRFRFIVRNSSCNVLRRKLNISTVLYMFVTAAAPRQQPCPINKCCRKQHNFLVEKIILTLQDSLREKGIWNKKLKEYGVVVVVVVSKSEVGKV